MRLNAGLRFDRSARTGCFVEVVTYATPKPAI